MARVQIFDEQGDTWSFAPPTAATSLSAVTANVNGTVIDFGHPVTRVSIQTSTTGGPTAGTVTLMVSLDGTSFVASGTTAAITANPAVAHLANVAVRYVRCDLSALAGGTAPTVTAKVMCS